MASMTISAGCTISSLSSYFGAKRPSSSKIALHFQVLRPATSPSLDHDFLRAARIVDHATLFLRLLDLFVVGEEMGEVFQRGHGHADLAVFLLLQAGHGAGDVHRHVAAADDRDLLRHRHVLAGGDPAQKIDGRLPPCRCPARGSSGPDAGRWSARPRHRPGGAGRWLISLPTRMLQRISTPIDSMTEISWSSTS